MYTQRSSQQTFMGTRRHLMLDSER